MNQIPDALPQLARGGHVKGSGKACIMNAISYINGDSVITDMPSCTHPLLAKFAQRLNDNICTHRSGGSLLCSACSHLMWVYGARLIGTAEGTRGWSTGQEAELSAKLARFAADQVAHLKTDAAAHAADAADAAAAYAAAAYAAAAYAAYAADAAAYAAYAADAAAYAAYAADAADAYADAAYASAARYDLHMKLVDEFYRLTGLDQESTKRLSEADYNTVLAGACLVQ